MNTKSKENLMNLIESVYDISERFMIDPKHVNIDYEQLSRVADEMKKSKPIEFPKKDIDDVYKSCLIELVGNAINYCYWYGKSSVRPLYCCSTKMYDVVFKAFERYKKYNTSYSFDDCIDSAIKYLSVERFPLLEERIKHLNELKTNGERFVETICKQNFDLDYLLTIMVQIFPGYASDMFLKRAFLFFCQVNRNLGLFEDDVKNIPVPADYQVPNMLRYHNIINYNSESLYKKIQYEKLIPKGSLMECEIRSATVLACRQLVKETGWSTPQVDGYFWLRRKEITTPFHLTITSDY